MPATTRDTSRKRDAILDAALKAFQSEGFDNASMDRVAELAGASKRTVYNHFASKDALFKAVVERFMGEITALKQVPYDPDRGLDEQLAQFADTKMHMLENPAWMGLFKVGLGVLVRDPELARESLAQASSGEDHLVRWLESATADGRLQVHDPELTAEVFWSMFAGAFVWPHLLHGPLEKAHASALKEELIRMFLVRYETVAQRPRQR